MKQHLITWLTLLLFAGSVWGQDPQQPPPTAPGETKTIEVDPPLPEVIVREISYLDWDKMIITDEYQRTNFTYPYLSAILRRTLTTLGIKYNAVLVQPITIGHDGWYEPMLKNPLRSVPGAYYSWGANKDDQFDGHFASIARIIFPEGFVVNCVSTFTRRKVDPYFTWVRLTPCTPDFGTQEAWKRAAELDLEGFLDLERMTFEKTPHVNIGPDSFKSRRPKR